MNSRVTVQVMGYEFTLISEDPEAYIEELAESVNQEISEIMGTSHLSVSHAAIMTALNRGDKAQKASDSAEHLREQIKAYLDETQKLKAELAETRRELSRAKKQA